MTAGSAKRRIPEAEAALRSFTHDVCTPLANIKLAADLLISGGGRISEEALVDLGSTVSSETDRLRWMFDTLLEWSRLTTQNRELRRRWLLAEDLIADATRRLTQMRDDCTVNVHIEPDMALIHGDESLLGLALTTLLDHAAHSSPRTEPIEVRVEADRRHCLIEVIDAGAALEQAGDVEQDVLFGARAGRPGAPGGGLGLLVSREIIAAHDSRLRARSRTDTSGAVFCFTLEYGGEPPPEDPIAAAYAGHNEAT